MISAPFTAEIMYIKGMKESFYDFDKREIDNILKEADEACEKRDSGFSIVYLWDIFILPLFKTLKDTCSWLR
jgi:hypothetical protein